MNIKSFEISEDTPRTASLVVSLEDCEVGYFVQDCQEIVDGNMEIVIIGVDTEKEECRSYIRSFCTLIGEKK